MENSLKGLLLAAGILITCFVIGIGFYVSRQSKDTSYAASSSINKLQSEFQESDKTMYDNVDFPGSEVMNVVNKFQSDTFAIVVTTKSGTEYYIYSVSGTEGDYTLGAATSSSLTEAKKVTSASYINPTKLFTGKVLRSKNDAIIGIQFTQK